MARALRAAKGGSPSHQMYLKVSRNFPHDLWLQIYSLLLFTEWHRRTSIPYGIQCSVIPLTPVDCRSTGENKEVAKDLVRERESNSCLKRCSEVLDPSPPSATVLDSSVIVRDSLERRPPFEGNVFCFTAELSVLCEHVFFCCFDKNS